MASYGFVTPVKPGKLEAWKGYIGELKGARKKDLEASRKKIGLSKEEVWLQKTPMGDFAVVHFECSDPGKVLQHFMTSKEPFDVWFREKILVEVHGLDPKGPPPALNEKIFG